MTGRWGVSLPAEYRQRPSTERVEGVEAVPRDKGLPRDPLHDREEGVSGYGLENVNTGSGLIQWMVECIELRAAHRQIGMGDGGEAGAVY